MKKVCSICKISAYCLIIIFLLDSCFSVFINKNVPRSERPLSELLHGHWYNEQYDRHDFFYYEKTGNNEYYYISWHVDHGSQVCDEVFQGKVVSIDEETNSIILSYLSDDEEYVYYNRYTFSDDRSYYEMAWLDSNFNPRSDFGIRDYVYIDDTSVSKYAVYK